MKTNDLTKFLISFFQKTVKKRIRHNLMCFNVTIYFLTYTFKFVIHQIDKYFILNVLERF